MEEITPTEEEENVEPIPAEPNAINNEGDALIVKTNSFEIHLHSNIKDVERLCELSVWVRDNLILDLNKRKQTYVG